MSLHKHRFESSHKHRFESFLCMSTTTYTYSDENMWTRACHVKQIRMQCIRYLLRFDLCTVAVRIHEWCTCHLRASPICLWLDACLSTAVMICIRVQTCTWWSVWQCVISSRTCEATANSSRCDEYVPQIRVTPWIKQQWIVGLVQLGWN